MNLPFPDLWAVASGESVVVFVPPGSCRAGDVVELAGGSPRTESDLTVAYRRWSDRPVPGRWTATIVEVHPSAAFDEGRLQARHVLARMPVPCDVAVVRVDGDDGAVLSEEAFAARLRSVRDALC